MRAGDVAETGHLVVDEDGMVCLKAPGDQRYVGDIDDPFRWGAYLGPEPDWARAEWVELTGLWDIYIARAKEKASANAFRTTG